MFASRFRRQLSSVLYVLAVSLTGVGASKASAAGPALLPLVTFYSPSRGDYFSTTQSAWTCRALGSCAGDPGYGFVAVSGYVYNPANPRPAGTVPLYHWWSPSRGDNFLTTDPAWAGSVGATRLDHDGYQLFRIEGYVPSSRVAGSVPLASFWNPTTRDNAAVNPLRTTLPAAWTRYRTEGYLLGPGSPAGRACAMREEPNHEDEPWTALGNYHNTWSGDLMHGDALQINAHGQTRIDFWGAHKNVAGEGVAPAGWPAPGEPMYALIGRVTSGRVWVPNKGYYEAGAWFLVGAGTACLEYNAQGVPRGDLQMTINDTNLGDNAGGPSVTVNQYW